MDFVILIFVGIVAYVIGIFGWAQIIGSFQNIKQRGLGMTFFTILIWVGIIFGAFLISKSFFSNQLLGFYLGIIISFVQIIFAGKIE